MRYRAMYGITLSISLMLLATAAAATEPVRNAAERAGDRQELRQDRRATRDDAGDRLEIEILRDEFEAGRGAADAGSLARIEEDVFDYILIEADEAGVEIAKAKIEERRDRRELRSDRREIRSNRREGASVARRMDDRHDRRDDRRDLRDDRSDTARQAEQKKRLEEILTEWEALRGKSDTPSLDQKSGILVELEAMAMAEIEEDGGERKEDRRERREDRRETREDRREG